MLLGSHVPRDPGLPGRGIFNGTESTAYRGGPKVTVVSPDYGPKRRKFADHLGLKPQPTRGQTARTPPLALGPWSIIAANISFFDRQVPYFPRITAANTSRYAEWAGSVLVEKERWPNVPRPEMLRVPTFQGAGLDEQNNRGTGKSVAFDEKTGATSLRPGSSVFRLGRKRANGGKPRRKGSGKGSDVVCRLTPILEQKIANDVVREYPFPLFSAIRT